MAFGTVSGAIKDFDMKSKKIVRTQAKRHKKSITSLYSQGKYLISCSSEDNLIIVYDYSKQEEYREVHLLGAEVLEGDLPCTVILFKDLTAEYLLIGSVKGQIYIYDLNNKCFGENSLGFKSKIIQIKAMSQSDKVSGSFNIFTALAQGGQLKVFRINERLEFSELCKELQKDMCHNTNPNPKPGF